jgi:ADP-ribosyl-[dinitrogen reductase] hydrolase
MAEQPLDRIRGSLLGGALGDALGAVVEFASLADIRSRYGPDGITDLARGDVTDDTQMTLFTAEGLIRTQNDHGQPGNSQAASDVWRSYQRWLHTQDASFQLDEGTASGWLLTEAWLHHRRAPGSTCLSALYGGEMGSPHHRINNSKGCGGVMRVAPCGMLALNEAATYTLGAECAALTHGHPSGFVSAGALALMIRSLFLGTDLETAVTSSLDFVTRRVDAADAAETIAALKLAAELAGHGPEPVVPSQLGQGWVGEEALAIAAYCALVATDFRRGVTLAVNHSGDSDSTGAITGNLLGAAWGARALPTDWLDRVEGKATIDRLAAELAAHFWQRDSPDHANTDPNG